MFGKRFAAGDKRRTHPFGRGCCAEQHPWLGKIHDIGPAQRRFYFNVVVNYRVGIIISINLPLILWKVPIKFSGVSLGSQRESGWFRFGSRGGRSMMSAAMDGHSGQSGAGIHGRRHHQNPRAYMVDDSDQHGDRGGGQNRPGGAARPPFTATADSRHF